MTGAPVGFIKVKTDRARNHEEIILSSACTAFHQRQLMNM